MSGDAVELPASAFDILVRLVEEAGAVVSRTSLLASVWPHVTVVENSINQAVATIRRALDDDPGKPKYVETVTGRGYRFAGEVRTESPADRDPETFQLYVAGWSALTRPGPRTLEVAQSYLERAIARDPGFTLAMVCLAEAHMLLGSHGVRPPLVAFPQAHAAIDAALKSDPMSAEAHAMLSQLVFVHDLDIGRAASLMERALELDPASFLAYRCLGMQMAFQGRLGEALAALRRAQAIEPLAVHINGNIGMAYYFAGRFEEAIVQLEHTLRLDANWIVAQSILGRSYIGVGQFDRALEFLGNGDGARRGRIPDLAIAYALCGRSNDAYRELARLSLHPEGEYVPPIHFVMIHAALGDHDAALDWVDRVLEERVNTFFLVSDPLLRDLRKDPRFARRFEQVGLSTLLGRP